MEYTEEQLKRQAHLEAVGSPEGYDYGNDYDYAITLSYDGKPPHWTKRFKFALEAVRVYDSFTDWGMAENYSTVNLAEPNGKLWTRHLYREGRKVVNV